MVYVSLNPTTRMHLRGELKQNKGFFTLVQCVRFQLHLLQSRAIVKGGAMMALPSNLFADWVKSNGLIDLGFNGPRCNYRLPQPNYHLYQQLTAHPPDYYIFAIPTTPKVERFLNKFKYTVQANENNHSSSDRGNTFASIRIFR